MSNEPWKCPNCGTENDSENNFCGDCGTKKPETGIGMAGKAVPCAKRKKCCGEFLDAGFKFCPKCGKPVDLEESREEKEAKQFEEQKTEEQIVLDPNNYVDKGDYIELVYPIGNIQMIEQMCFFDSMTWDQAMRYAKNLRKGGFSDWRVPTKEELKIIYEIKDICGIDKNEGRLWSSSKSNNTDCAWIVSFEDGYVFDDNKSYDYHVRCVR